MLADATQRLKAAGIESARADARLLLAHVLGLSADEAIRLDDQSVPPAFEAVLLRRLAREPVAYITGRREFWSLNYGQLYRTLDRLERAGLIGGTEQFQSGRPSRKVYRITASGRQSLDDWLLLPPTYEPRPLRDELSVKLLFLTDAKHNETLALIRSQRAIYLQHLARLTKRRSVLEEAGQGDSFVTRLLLVQADMRVRADLAWLDLVEQELLQRSGKPSSTSRPALSRPR